MSGLANSVPNAPQQKTSLFNHLVGGGLSVSGTVRPSALAVCKLMTNSNLVDCSTGRSASPLRIRAAIAIDNAGAGALAGHAIMTCQLSQEVAMRNVIFLRVLTLISAIAVTGLFAGAAFGGTVHLGFHSLGEIDNACVNAPDGQVTGGTGEGGYGCKTSKGEVSCSKEGDCTGTCSNCSDRVIRQTVMQGVLQGLSFSR
jgi:hypothetical protein